MKKLLILSLLALSCQSASAQLVTESFGSGDNAFTMDFVTIGNPGNAADTQTNIWGNAYSAGSVSYLYNLGKHEISREIIDKANLSAALELTLRDLSGYTGNGANKPATGISWKEAAKFVNYLNTSQGYNVAYKFDLVGNFQMWTSSESGFNSTNLFRNALAKFFLPSNDEWYKGAYGSPSGTWYQYPNSSNTAPLSVANGVNQNTAVWDGKLGPADIKDAGGLIAWGTMAQGGNAWEWMETAFDGENNVSDEKREVRGGNWYTDLSYGDLAYDLDRTVSYELNPNSEDYGILNPRWLDSTGFRVASVPEPTSLSLLALGGVVMAFKKRRQA